MALIKSCLASGGDITEHVEVHQNILFKTSTNATAETTTVATTNGKNILYWGLTNLSQTGNSSDSGKFFRGNFSVSGDTLTWSSVNQASLNTLTCDVILVTE